MDSLGGSRGKYRLSDPIRHFLTYEWKLKHGSEKSFTKDMMPDYHPRVPYQTNTSDCGLYVLQYVETFLKVEL